LPESQSAPVGRMLDREPLWETPWLEPYPDAALEGLADRAAGPEALYRMKEAVAVQILAEANAGD